MADKDLRVNFIAHDTGLTKKFHEVGAAADKTAEHVSRVGEHIKHLAELAGGFALAEMFKGAFTEATKYQALLAQTNAVIKSTGNVAGLSVDGLEKQAHALQELSGTQEALILNGENVLATFTNIRNAAGAGNDIFDQATKATLDMSTALHQDLQSATILVGKALQDPIKGLTSLRRVGVAFSADQLKLIKHLTETGHGMQAQKLILAELSKEFGGSAKAAGGTFAGSMAKLRNTFNDTARDLAAKLMPWLQKAAQWLQEHIPKAIAAAKVWFDKLRPTLTTVVNALKSVVSWIAKNKDSAIAIAQGIGVVVVAWKAWTTAVKVWNTVMKANWIAILVIALAGLATWLIHTWKTSEKFRDIVTGVWNKILDVVGYVVAKIVEGVRGLLHIILSTVRGILHAMAAALGWVPGIGPKLKRARDAFDHFEATTLNGMQHFADSTMAWGDAAGKNFARGVYQGLNAAQIALQQGHGPQGSPEADAWAQSHPASMAADRYDPLTGSTLKGNSYHAPKKAPGFNATPFTGGGGGGGGSSKAGKKAGDLLVTSFADAIKHGAHIPVEKFTKILTSIKSVTASVMAGIAKSVSPVDESLTGLTASYARLSNAAVAHAQTYAIASAHAAELKEHSDYLAAALKAVTAAHLKASAAMKQQAADAKKAADAAKSNADKFKAAADTMASSAQEAAGKVRDAVQAQVDAFTAGVKDFNAAMTTAIAGGAFDLSKLWTDPVTGEGSLGVLQATLNNQLIAVTQFANDLKQLAAGGASQDLIAQIAGMGPQQGDQLAQQLINGGADAIAGIQDTMSKIAAVSKAGADDLTKQFFEPGQTALGQFIAGIDSQMPALRAALAAIARETAATFADLGLGGAVAANKPGGKASSSAQPLVAHITVESHIDGKQVATATRTHLLKLQNRNVSSGFN